MARGANNTETSSVGTRHDKQVKRQGGQLDELALRIRAALSDDLLKPEYRDNPRPYAGHCYVASEVYYHLKGGKAAGYKASGMEHEGAQHWWLEDSKGEVIDLTAEQFTTPVPYHRGRGRGFLTREPSKRAKLVIERINK